MPFICVIYFSARTSKTLSAMKLNINVIVDSVVIDTIFPELFSSVSSLLSVVEVNVLGELRKLNELVFVFETIPLLHAFVIRFKSLIQLSITFDLCGLFFKGNGVNVESSG